MNKKKASDQSLKRKLSNISILKITQLFEELSLVFQARIKIVH